MNKACRFVDCLTFCDGDEFWDFYGVSNGTLSYTKRGDIERRAKSNFWCVFIPNNCDKTLAEMSDEVRRNRNDSHTSATTVFDNVYKEVYFKQKVKKLTG